MSSLFTLWLATSVAVRLVAESVSLDFSTMDRCLQSWAHLAVKIFSTSDRDTFTLCCERSRSLGNFSKHQPSFIHTLSQLTLFLKGLGQLKPIWWNSGRHFGQATSPSQCYHRHADFRHHPCGQSQFHLSWSVVGLWVETRASMSEIYWLHID